MDHRNVNLLQLDMKQRAREREADGIPLLIQQLTQLVPRQEELLDQQFTNTCDIITVGYAIFVSALRVTGRRTFIPAMRRFQSFQALPAPIKDEINDLMRLITRIMKHYDLIVFNITRPSMQYLDVRRLSIEQISRCMNDKWADDYNILHMPKELRRHERHDREYPQYMIDEVVENIPGSTERVLDRVDNNEEQIKLIGKDITKALLVKARNSLLNQQ